MLHLLAIAALFAPALAGPSGLPGAWDAYTDVDVVVISHGDEVALEDALVPDHYTVFDFGAPWCGPCKITAAVLAEYLGQHEDVAVRAIELDARTPEASFAMPAAQQHLKFVAGLPWLLVYTPDGKRIFKGADVNAAIADIDARRVKDAK